MTNNFDFTLSQKREILYFFEKKLRSFDKFRNCHFCDLKVKKQGLKIRLQTVFQLLNGGTHLGLDGLL